MLAEFESNWKAMYLNVDNYFKLYTQNLPKEIKGRCFFAKQKNVLIILNIGTYADVRWLFLDMETKTIIKSKILDVQI
jgi:hypothetical protein